MSCYLVALARFMVVDILLEPGVSLRQSECCPTKRCEHVHLGFSPCEINFDLLLSVRSRQRDDLAGMLNQVGNAIFEARNRILLARVPAHVGTRRVR